MTKAEKHLKNDSPVIEIGVIVVDVIELKDQQALNTAIKLCECWLSKRYGQFQWKFTLLNREEIKTNSKREPSALMVEGSAMRDAEGWDFAFLITGNELNSRYKPYALAASSSALDLAVISTKRIDPQPYSVNNEDDQRNQILAERLHSLILHCLGHINGLRTSEDHTNFMYLPQSASELDSMQALDKRQMQTMLENLEDVADVRLEEMQDAARFSALRFYAHSAWINRREILSSLAHAKPWEFPLRLIKLSAAATSAMLVLKTTAEAWELASHQSLTTLTALLCCIVFIGTSFVIIKQHLFVRRLRNTLTEQIVITNISASLIVFLGMMATAAALMIFNALLSTLLYPPAIVSSWTNSDFAGWQLYLKANLLMTSLGLLIGALGASFELQHHFRHIVFVDEEI